MIYELPTLSDRLYRGKYPDRVHSWGYSQSPTQRFIADFLGNRSCVHIELNCGRRFIGEVGDFYADGVKIGIDFAMLVRVRPTPIKLLSQERYDEMIAGVRKIRENAL